MRTPTALLHCVCLGLAAPSLALAATVKNLSTDEAYRILCADPNIFLLDVRTHSEYEEGHIPGAYLIPNTEISERKEELPANKSTPLIVYCRSGARSASASSLLWDLGYENVGNVLGGFLEWEEKGYPIVSGPDAGTFPVPDALGLTALSPVLLFFVVYEAARTRRRQGWNLQARRAILCKRAPSPSRTKTWGIR